MAFHTLEITDTEPTHWVNNRLVLNRTDSARLLSIWNRTPGLSNSIKEYEDWIKDQCKDAPRK